jgi:hypothetical protein
MSKYGSGFPDPQRLPKTPIGVFQDCVLVGLRHSPRVPSEAGMSSWRLVGLADFAGPQPGLTGVSVLPKPEKGEEPPVLKSAPRGGLGWKSPTSYLGCLRKQPPGSGPPPARDFSPGDDTECRAAMGTPASPHHASACAGSGCTGPLSPLQGAGCYLELKQL